MPIADSVEPQLCAEEFRAVLVASTLGERRPVENLGRLDRVLPHADHSVTAGDGDRLLGASRTISDFSYCGCLSNLVVDVGYQRQDIGKRLIAERQRDSREQRLMILMAARATEQYHPRIGMEQRPSCWTLPWSQ